MLLSQTLPISFPHYFIYSLVEAHKSSSSAHALFFPIFIHRILLCLGLDEFLAFGPIHIIAPIGATFLRQRAAQMRASFKHLRVESSSGVAPPPSLGDSAANAFVDPTTTVDPPPFVLDVSSIRRTLDTVMIVQAAHGQLLVDVLTELQALRADLVSIRWSPPPPPFMMSDCLLAIRHKKKEYIWIGYFVNRGEVLLFWSCGALDCI